MVGRSFSAVSACVLLTGCASTQLNHNTLDLASSTDKLLTKQVHYNLSNFIDSPIAIPAQVVIAAGTASTTNAITPSLSFPLINGTAIEEAAGRLTRTTTKPAAGAGLSATDVWSQNWALRPITNPDRLQRLQALYRFAVDQDERALVTSFPLITKSVQHSRPVCVTNQTTGRCVTVEDLNKRYDPSRFGADGRLLAPQASPDGTASGSASPDARFLIKVPATGVSAGSASASAGADQYSTQVPDEYYLTGPGCIVCLKPGARPASASHGGLQANPTLKGHWLHWRGLPGAARRDTVQAGDIFLGREGKYELYVDGRRPDAYVGFVAATLAASTQTQTAGAGGAGGGGFISSGGRRGDEDISDLSAPALQPALTIPIE